jgi:hypothetical protein
MQPTVTFLQLTLGTAVITFYQAMIPIHALASFKVGDMALVSDWLGTKLEVHMQTQTTFIWDKKGG